MKFKNAIGTLVMLALLVTAWSVGVLSGAAVCAIGFLFQLAMFATAKPCAQLFNSVLTPEQVKEFQDILAELKGGWAKVKDLPNTFKTLEEAVSTVKTELDNFRKAQLSQRQSRPAKQGQVSDECARHLGAIALLFGAKAGRLEGVQAQRAADIFKDVTGVEMKTALTSSDIPLPTIYSGEVSELVSIWGAARQYATVFPLGGATVKLPKLSTDPTFGLIAGSGSVTEKSPQAAWVTFTAEKFGGMVRLPSEMDEDSIIPIGQFLARYSARQLAYVEDYQVFRSTGAASGLNGTAEGLCKNVVTDSKTTTSTSKGSPSEFTLAFFRALRTVCDAAALRVGAYYLHPTFEQLLASFNTAGDKPYNPNAQIAGNGAQPFMTGPTLDGFPIRWLDVMPVYTTSDVLSTVHVLFGDVSFQYLGVRGGIRFDTSTEAGFTTDEILVRALERITTGKMATGAVAGLVTAAA